MDENALATTDKYEIDPISLFEEEVRFQKALAIMERINEGASTTAACEAVGVPVRTFYHWRVQGVLTEHILGLRRIRAEMLTERAANRMLRILDHQAEIADGSIELERGMNPTSAARFVADLAGGKKDDDRHQADRTPPPTLVPQFVQFNVYSGSPPAGSLPAEDILDGECEDV